MAHFEKGHWICEVSFHLHIRNTVYKGFLMNHRAIPKLNRHLLSTHFFLPTFARALLVSYQAHLYSC